MNPDDLTDEQLAQGVTRGVESLAEVISKLPSLIMQGATEIGKMNRRMTRLPIEARRKQLERVLGTGTMKEDLIMARRVQAKKATSLGDVVANREPRFMCPEHRKRLVFSKLNQVWECPEPRCTRSRLPSMDRTDTTVIKSAPRLVGREDDDGDIHWYLQFSEENILVVLPFAFTTHAMGTDGPPFGVSVTYGSTDVVVYDRLGNVRDLNRFPV